MTINVSVNNVSYLAYFCLVFKELPVKLFPMSILKVALLFNSQDLDYLIFLRKH